MARALKTQGTKLYYAIGSPTEYVALGNIVGFDGPGGVSMIYDRTNLDDGTHRHYKAKLIDAGAANIELNLDPSSTDHAALKAAQEAGTVLSIKIAPPNFSKSLYFDARVKQFGIVGAADSKYKGAVSLLVGRGGFWWLDNAVAPVYATFDPAAKAVNITLSNGNLTATSSGVAAYRIAKATGYKSSGKWYCEFSNFVLGAAAFIGIANSTAAISGYSFPGSDINGYGYNNAGFGKWHGGTNSNYGMSWGSQFDVISMLFDADAGELSWWFNGADQGVAFTGIAGSYVAAVAEQLTSTIVANFGASAFAYSPPAGYQGWTV